MKNGQNPPKKRCFYQPRWGWSWCDHHGNVHHSCSTFEDCPQKLPTFEDKLGQLVRGADKNTFFWRFLARFSSCFLLFHGQFVYEMPFLQKKSFHLTFSSRRSVGYKVPPRIGGHHFLLCQQTNTKDIAGQSAIRIWVITESCFF